MIIEEKVQERAAQWEVLKGIVVQKGGVQREVEDKANPNNNNQDPKLKNGGRNQQKKIVIDF